MEWEGECSQAARDISEERMKHRVYIVDSAQVPHGDDGIEREVLGDCAHVELLKLDSEEELEPYASEADGIILWHHVQLTARMLKRLTKTRIVVRNGVGYDNVDVETARALGIAVANVPDYGTEEVADHAIALMLALIRQLKPLSESVAEGHWEWQAGGECRRIRGRVLGLVGCGRIGTAVALRAKALGFLVKFYDPYLESGYEKAIGVERYARLEELLAGSDVVSVHVPLTNETRHLIGEAELRQMKESAYLINTARGAVVSDAAVRKALENRWIAGAGLDVLEDEPVGARELQSLANCIVTPHSAFYSQESMVEMRQKSALTVKDALVHGRYRNVVNQVASGTRSATGEYALNKI